MRVLLGCSMGGSGHLLPLLGVAGALRDRGEECVLLVPPSLQDAASTSRLRVVVGEQPPSAVVEEIWERVRQGPPERVVGLIDRELFAGLATDAMRAGAEALCDQLAPDLVVREACEYATAMAAHTRGVPHMQVGISAAAIEKRVLDGVAASLDRRCPGVSDAIRRAPYLTSFPEALDPSPWSDTRRYRETTGPPTPLPDWWRGREQRPLVYVTFGSVLSGVAEAHDVYRTALAAVADLPLRILMTVGRRYDLDHLRPVPDNTHVERWVSQADVFAAADLVVCHGGSGTTNGALAAGLPLVVCPLFADQTANAATVERIGAGVVVRSQTPPRGGIASLRPEDAPVLADAIRACLGNPRHRVASRRIAAAVAATPTLAEALDRRRPHA